MHSLRENFKIHVEIEEARLRALTHQILLLLQILIMRRNRRSPIKGIDTTISLISIFVLIGVEIEEARLRALTQTIALLLFFFRFRVEIEEARLRALTLLSDAISARNQVCRNRRSPIKGIDTSSFLKTPKFPFCRNRRSPIKGIDTSEFLAFQTATARVEIEEARLRALTPKAHCGILFFFQSRNRRSPIKGIDTLFFLCLSGLSLFVEIEEARLRALTHCDGKLLLYSFLVEIEEARLRALTPSRISADGKDTAQKIIEDQIANGIKWIKKPENQKKVIEAGVVVFNLVIKKSL